MMLTLNSLFKKQCHYIFKSYYFTNKVIFWMVLMRGISFIYTMHMHRILLNPLHLRVKLSEIMPAQAHSNYIQFRAVLHICEIPLQAI